MTDRKTRLRRSRLEELLATRAVEPVAGSDADEIGELLAEFPSIDDTSFDRAAAAIWLAATQGRRETMPAAVRRRIMTTASAQSEHDTDD